MPVIFPRVTDEVTIDTGDITVEIAPPSAGTLTVDQGYTVTVPTFPVTSLRIFLRNVGSAIAGGSDVAIVVNGDNVAVGESRTFEARLDPVTNVYKYIAAPTVTNAGSAGIWFEIDS